jgi:hypothetical protein
MVYFPEKYGWLMEFISLGGAVGPAEYGAKGMRQKAWAFQFGGCRSLNKNRIAETIADRE